MTSVYEEMSTATSKFVHKRVENSVFLVHRNPNPLLCVQYVIENLKTIKTNIINWLFCSLGTRGYFDK